MNYQSHEIIYQVSHTEATNWTNLEGLIQDCEIFLKDHPTKKLKIGFPFLLEERTYDIPKNMGEFMKENVNRVTCFFYYELNKRRGFQKWVKEFPEIKSSKSIYFKATEETDWGLFIGSIWDLAREGIDIRLLDSNKIFLASNPMKKLNSLVLRGVSLGFFPRFPKKWFQSENKVINQYAKLKLVDFWTLTTVHKLSEIYEKEFQTLAAYEKQLFS